jgi:hypothetical protein
MALARRQPAGAREGQVAWALRSLFWAPDPVPPGDADQPPVPNAHDFFSEMHWMIARADPASPDGLVLAAKGGHNGEMHNQNDVGNIIVHVNQESVIADIGRGRYTRDYFGPQRYEHLASSSLGHSVPVPNGCAQVQGKQYGAKLLAHRAGDELDLLELDLKGAYPEQADLAALVRRVALHRGSSPWVELQDQARFASRPGTLESVLITFGQAAAPASGTVLLKGERAALAVGYDPNVVTPEIEVVPDVDLAIGRRAVTRVRFIAKPQREVTIRLEIRPTSR